MLGSRCHAVEREHGHDRTAEQRRAAEHEAGRQIHRVRHPGDRFRDRATGDRAERAADADEREHPLALVQIEEIDHERPEHAIDEQVYDAQPDEIGVPHRERETGSGIRADEPAAAPSVGDQQRREHD
jgi:hypothetical protein